MINPTIRKITPIIFEIWKKGIVYKENTVPITHIPINIGHSITILMVGFAKKYLSNRLSFLITSLIYRMGFGNFGSVLRAYGV
jgi:hypothetical protein